MAPPPPAAVAVEASSAESVPSKPNKNSKSSPEISPSQPKISSIPPSPAHGLTLHEDGEASFRVWAPHARAVTLELASGSRIKTNREGDTFAVRLCANAVSHGDRYRVALTGPDGTEGLRRDPYARATEYESEWCFATDVKKYEWKCKNWQRPSFDSYIIYEMHIGSFTGEGSFAAAELRLEHIKQLGFTCVQVLPILEHSDEWGYNPRLFMSLHGEYGTPEEFMSFVDKAHELGLAVIVDVVLHHAAVKKNSLWDYDGWEHAANGGIYHEGAPDTEWGRALAHWKVEVMDMLKASCMMYFNDYHCDGLRFDSANDLPRDLCQTLTYHLRTNVPGCFLTAEVTPENPQAVHELGFDNLWIHSAYFDIIHQHRALGRGAHGGGEFAQGWDFPRLRTVMGLHYGFTWPTQCTKYLLGSHDQIGCKNNGAIYEDYRMIGGQHRYAVDQFGGGRGDEWALSATRAWFTANCCAAGILMMFMGSEWAQMAWWDTKSRRLEWVLSQDKIGKGMMKLVSDGLSLRKQYTALRLGGTNTLHEDRQNGVLGVDRVYNDDRIVVVINAGRGSWQNSEYRIWVGGNGYALKEILCSCDEKYAGWKDQTGNTDRVVGVYDGWAHISIPAQSTLVFQAISA